jgi:formylglycine-generating enzyme required for sulfatase activity
MPPPRLTLVRAPETADSPPQNETYCPSDQTPQFNDGFAFLKQQLGEDMGDPISCEYYDEAGNAYQMTTTGQAIYLKQTNTSAFVRGNQYWAWTAEGLVNQTPPPEAALMTFVPDGPFDMGGRQDGPDELPIHLVKLDAFHIDRYEITNAQYRRCVEAGTCEPPKSCMYGEPTYSDEARANHPVVCASWFEAKTYCQWRGARLPTEAEWEKAARGTDRRIYPWGNESPGRSLLNYDRNVGATTPVGSYPEGASPYGLYDMAGNVWEWVADWYDQDYYEHSPTVNPTGPASGEYLVLRSGAFNDDWTHIRTTNRNRDKQTDTADSLGFRCVR